MSRLELAPTLRMGERALIVMGGIVSIYLGYRLFALGINVTQGQARAFGIELREFGPGLFFAALGAYVLVQALRAAIRTGTAAAGLASESETATTDGRESKAASVPAAPASSFFFGVEDPIRLLNTWSAKSFFLETRDLIKRLEAGGDPAEVTPHCSALKKKLETITMTAEEYGRYQLLTNKTDLNADEQTEFLRLDDKLFP